MKDLRVLLENQPELLTRAPVATKGSPSAAKARKKNDKEAAARAAAEEGGARAPPAPDSEDHSSKSRPNDKHHEFEFRDPSATAHGSLYLSLIHI